jgi:sulfatase maturation enzyme AslB (radical SAM superfamily)
LKDPTQSPTYCKLSHVSLAIQNEGDICVCNKNTQSFEDGKQNKLYLHESGLKKMWASPTRKLLQAGLDNGRRLASCQACWNDEDAGVRSVRQRFNQELKDLESIKTQPRILIIKPSNTCNMACRMCQPSTSTSLYQDFYQRDIELKDFVGLFSEYTKQFETIRLGLGKNNLSVWDTFEEWLPNLHFLDIYGGEPMLAPAMWSRMVACADNNLVSDVSIQFHTNGTIWNQSYVDTLSKFKHVQIAISIDSHIPEQLSYIRHLVDVDKLYLNLKKYIELSKQYSNISVNICFTLSIYNIWYADEIYAGLSEFNLPISINPVYGPKQYDIRHLPIPVKNQIIKKLEKDKKPNLLKLVKILNHTIPGCDIYWPKFWKEAQILDRIRNQKFEQVFPEYYEAIKPFLPE